MDPTAEIMCDRFAKRTYGSPLSKEENLLTGGQKAVISFQSSQDKELFVTNHSRKKFSITLSDTMKNKPSHNYEKSTQISANTPLMSVHVLGIFYTVTVMGQHGKTQTA